MNTDDRKLLIEQGFKRIPKSGNLYMMDDVDNERIITIYEESKKPAFVFKRIELCVYDKSDEEEFDTVSESLKIFNSKYAKTGITKLAPSKERQVRFLA